MVRSTVLIHKPRIPSAVYGIPAILFFIFACIYVQTQFQGLSGGDAGDFVTNAYMFGIPHAPGYPLYTLLAGLVAHAFQFSTVEWRIGLLSSIPTALAVYFFWRSAFKITKSIFASTVAACCFGMLGVIWLNAIGQEVFGLFLLFASIWIDLFITWKQMHAPKYLVYLAFFGVLAFTHHQLILLCILPAFYSIVFDRDRIPLRTIWWKLLVAGILGCIPYLYFPIVAHFGIPFDLENATTVNGMLRLITRASYGTFRATASIMPSIVDRTLNVFTFFQFAFRDISIASWICLAIGWFSLRKTQRGIYEYLTVSLVLWLFYYFLAGFPLLLNFQVGTLERFFTVPYLILMLFVTQGIAWCTLRLHHLFLQPTQRILSIVLLISVLFMSAFPRLKAQVHAYLYAKNNHAMEWLAEDMLAGAPPQSILLTSEDTTTFAVYDALYVHKKRSDIHYVRLNLLGLPHYRQYLRKTYPDLYVPPETLGLPMNGLVADFFQQNMKRFAIMSDRPMSEISGLWVPYGLLYSYMPDEQAVLDYDALYRINADLWSQFRIPEDTLPYHKELLLLSDALRVYSQHYTNMAMIAVYVRAPIATVMQELERALQWAVNIVPEYYLQPVKLLIVQNRCEDAKLMLRRLYTLWGNDKAVLSQYAVWQKTCGLDSEVDIPVQIFRERFPQDAQKVLQ